MATIAQSHIAESEGVDFGLAPRLLLGSLSLAAGAVHLAMAPIHASDSALEAGGFAMVGWLQILLAIGLFMRPQRNLLIAAVVLNLGVIGAYIVSRTVGLPVGANPGERESIEAVDLMVTIFQAALVVGAGLLLVKPSLAGSGPADGKWSFEAIAMASAVPILVLFATSVTLIDPELAEHGHGGSSAGLVSSSGGGHGHGGAALVSADLQVLAEERCDLAFNPAAYWRETTLAGVDTLTGGATSMVDHNTSAAVVGSEELDKIVTTHVTGKGELGDARMVVALAGVSDEVYDNWLRWMSASGQSSHAHERGNALAPDDTLMGGHLGPQAWHAMTDQKQCDALEAELALARDTALKYPTVKDAKAAGWVQITPYVPGIAAHFMNFRLVDGKFDITEPEMILYDGTGDDAAVVGLSYYIRQDGDAEPTQGFTGNNDHYHRHVGLCVSGAGVIGDSTTTKEDCEARGGTKSEGTNGWMNHVWIVPGCESPWGMFSGASPILEMGLGRASGSDGGGCAGSGVRDRYDLNAGGIENTPTQVGGAVELAVGN
jgi:hypothetical protein